MLMVIIGALQIAGMHLTKNQPWVQFALGLFLVAFLPYSIYSASVKAFTSHARLQEPITYNFTYEKLIISGESFSAEKDWNKIYKIHELKSWFLLYDNNHVFNLISKKNMSPEEINELRAILYSVTIAGEKKLLK